MNVPAGQPAAERWIRIGSSLLTAVHLQGIVADVMADWVRAFAPIGPGKDNSNALISSLAFPLSVSVDGLRTHLVWSACGVAGPFLPRVANYLAELGAPEQAFVDLELAGKGLNPRQLGCWIQGSQDNVDVGWFLTGDFSRNLSAPHLHPGPAADILKTWADGCGVKTWSRVGKNIAEEGSYAEVMFTLPGADATTQVDHLQALLKAADLPLLREDLLIPLRGRAKPDLVASVWFSDIGFIKVGVLAPRPDTIMLLKALDLMGIQDDEAFSILEGLLGIKERGALEICLLGDSFVVEVHYDLAAIVPRT